MARLNLNFGCARLACVIAGLYVTAWRRAGFLTLQQLLSSFITGFQMRHPKVGAHKALAAYSHSYFWQPTTVTV